MSRKKHLKGYICGTDPLDISLGADDIKIFSSLKSFKKKRTCWKECGILELNISKAKLVYKGKGFK